MVVLFNLPDTKKTNYFVSYFVNKFLVFCQIFAENWKLHNRELCKVRASKFRGRTVTLIWHYSLQCSYHFWQTSLVFYNYRPRQGTPYHTGLKSILKVHSYLPRICNFFSNSAQILYTKINYEGSFLPLFICKLSQILYTSLQARTRIQDVCSPNLRLNFVY